jgi:hypothetical protein
VLVGFNHNLRHRGVLFHVQTEDGGMENPFVVTHVFVGGNVLANRRSSYDKFTGKAAVKEIVLAMMQEQHKEMMKDLVHGRLPSVEAYLGRTLPAETPAADPRPLSPPPKVAERPYRKPPPAPQRTLDTAGMEEKTLDELILEFLSQEGKDES